MSGLGLQRFVLAAAVQRLITLSIQHHNYPNYKTRVEIKVGIGWRSGTDEYRGTEDTAPKDHESNGQ